MKKIQTCKTVCGKKIYIYDVHFNYPGEPFATYWVAVINDPNYSELTNGFLIDGKRLCFKSEVRFYDIDMLTDGLSWLQDLRELATKAHPTKTDNTSTSILVSIERLRALVNEYALSDLSIHGSGSPILPEYDFVDFVEKTLNGK